MKNGTCFKFMFWKRYRGQSNRSGAWLRWIKLNVLKKKYQGMLMYGILKWSTRYVYTSGVYLNPGKKDKILFDISDFSCVLWNKVLYFSTSF